MSAPEIALVVAIAENGVIGAEGALPWKLSSDMAFFKRCTMGKPIIMGRKTYESIGRALPGRTNIVVSRQAGYQPEGVIVINSLEAAVDHGRTIALADKVDEVAVIGGANIYAQAMDVADRLYVTHVKAKPEGDVFFDPIDPLVWCEVAREGFEAGPKDDVGFDIVTYERARVRN